MNVYNNAWSLKSILKITQNENSPRNQKYEYIHTVFCDTENT